MSCPPTGRGGRARLPLLIVAILGLATIPGSGRGDPSVKRTKSQVEALIRKAGATPPDWWDSVKLDYPETLDLTWDKKNGLHEETKHTSLYLWWVCYPNPSRWKPGVKLLHHMLKVNQRDSGALQKTMAALGAMYHDLLQDYARAAFWWRKVGSSTEVRPKLAHCYWKLGSKEMAEFWGGKYRETIDIVRAVKSVTTPTFPHPVRLGRDEKTGVMTVHAAQPAAYALPTLKA